MPAVWRARRTRWHVSSRTLSGSDSRRFSAVRATTALSASFSCVHPRSARAARTWREVIIHDHLQCRRGILHQNDYNSRLAPATARECGRLGASPHLPASPDKTQLITQRVYQSDLLDSDQTIFGKPRKDRALLLQSPQERISLRPVWFIE